MQMDMKTFFGNTLNTNKDIDMSNFTHCVCSLSLGTNEIVFWNKLRKQHLTIKPAEKQKFFNRFTHSYLNNTTKPHSIEVARLRIRLWMFDYYFPEYIDSYLIPYIKDNASPDIQRAKHRVQKSMSIYGNLEDCRFQQIIDIDKARYEYIKNRYDAVNKEIEFVKNMNTQIRDNESKIVNILRES